MELGIGYLAYHVAFAGILLLLVQSLNLVWRTNLFMLGHHGFFCLGAYCAAVFITLCTGSGASWSLAGAGDRAAGLGIFGSSIVLSALVAGLIAWLLGFGLLRLRDDYFAVASLVLAEVIRITMVNWDFVGGGLGAEVPYLFLTNSSEELPLFLGFFVLLVVAFNSLLLYFSVRVNRSPIGLYIDAIRDDELASRMSGINVWQVRHSVLTASAAVAGAAGAIFLNFVTIIVPQDFSFIAGLPIILYVILGNLGLVTCIVSTVVLYIAYELIKLQFLGILGADIGAVIASWKEVFYSVVLVVAINVRAISQRRHVRSAVEELIDPATDSRDEDENGGRR